MASQKNGETAALEGNAREAAPWRRPKTVKPVLSEKLQEEILQWIEVSPPGRTLRHLRRMMTGWMLREQSGFPSDFEEMITDLDCLFELLDTIQEELRGEGEE